jgi:hypothetical protein
MLYRAAGESAASGHEPSNARIVCRALLGIWAYAAVSGAIAVGAGDFAAAAIDTSLPASWVRLGTAGVAVVAAGLRGEKVLARIADWLRTPSSPPQDQ